MNKPKRSQQNQGRSASGGRTAKRGAGKTSAARGGARPKPTKPARSAKTPAVRAADTAGDEPEGERIRLNKYLATHGVASRRAADELIASGGVLVDGEIATDLGQKVDPARQRIEVDGVVLKPEDVRLRYYLLNKPSGVVCTNDPRENRPRAIDLITDRRKGRIYTVGRLDEDTVGLVLLTNDGEFANRVMHPSFGLPKTYSVKLAGRIDDGAVAKLREGVYLSDGRTAGARVLVRTRSANSSKLLMTLYEGMNREVRRMVAKVGYKLLDLKRVRIGSLTDRGLKPGHWRPLTRAEVRTLLEECDPEREQQATPPGRGPSRRGAKPGAGRRPRPGAGR